jgi:hypothetical protein
VIEALVARARADPDTLGLLLSGSRGAGVAWAGSDYDLEWVLTDAAFDRRTAGGQPTALYHKGPDQPSGEALLDLSYTCPRELSRKVAGRDWVALGLATARVLLDKTGGDLDRLLRDAAAAGVLPGDRARAAANRSLGAYLNRFFRSLKCWHRGDELGARLHAAESVMHLLAVLFALEGRVAPFYDRVAFEGAALAGQGWAPGEPLGAVLAILRTGDPGRQLALEARVEALLRARGVTEELDSWAEVLPRTKALFR